MALQPGEQAPDFTLKNTSMEDVTLSSFHGKHNVVLLFVPFAFSGVCTQELCDITQGLSGYSALDAQVLGISVDSPFSQKAWAEKEGIGIPLLSDLSKEVSASYGDLLGFTGVAKRSAFVIDKQGVVRYGSVSEDAKVLPDFAAVKACLEAL
jgi:peroxiredoxin